MGDLGPQATTRAPRLPPSVAYESACAEGEPAERLGFGGRDPNAPLSLD